MIGSRRPAPAGCFLQNTRIHPTEGHARREPFGEQSSAGQLDKESARFFLRAAPNGKARSSCSGSERAKASITQRQIEKQARRGRYQVKNQDAGNAGKIGERYERDLGGESKRNVKPRSGDPRFGSIEQPKRAAQ